MKINFLKQALLTVAGAALLLTACDNSPYEGYEQTEAGTYYKFYQKNDTGLSPVVGDLVAIQFQFISDKDCVFVDSKIMSRSGKGIELLVQEPAFAGGVQESLMMMRKGDSASFRFSADSLFAKFFEDQRPEFIDSGSIVNFVVKLDTVIPKAEVEKMRAEYMAEMKRMEDEELAKIEAYVADNNVTAEPTQTGLYYVETKKGNGNKPAPGDKIKVHYTGKFVDGTVFDSSVDRGEPFEFMLGARQVIPGWDEGLSYMSVGGKAQLIIPSAMGYGAQPGGRIPPFTPLVFDVELLAITPNPQMEQMGQMIK